MEKRKGRILFFILFIGTFLMVSLWKNVSYGVFFLGIVYFVVMFFLFKDGTKNIAMILFLIAFFVFLMGGQFVYEVFGYKMDYSHSMAAYNYMNECLIISLISIGCSYYLTGLFLKRIEKSQFVTRYEYDYNNCKALSLQKASLLIFYGTCLFWFICLLEKVLFVQANSYVELYAEYKTQLPSMIVRLGKISPISFYCYLASMPSKKQCRIPMILYLCYAVLSLGSGRRMDLVTMGLFVVFYLILRNKINPGKDKWFGKKEIISCIIGVPVLLVFLYSYKYIRYGESTDFSLAKAFLGFFQQQGISANLIAFQYEHSSELAIHETYSFYDLSYFLRTNLFTRLFWTDEFLKLYDGERLFAALHGNSFANRLAYIVMKQSYLEGYGLGSCYVAELMQDFSYFGLVLGNIVYGILFKTLYNTGSHSPIKWYVGMIAFTNFMKAPRYNYDCPLSVLLDTETIAAILLIVLLSCLIARKSNSYTKQVIYIENKTNTI